MYIKFGYQVGPGVVFEDPNRPAQRPQVIGVRASGLLGTLGSGLFRFFSSVFSGFWGRVGLCTALQLSATLSDLANIEHRYR